MLVSSSEITGRQYDLPSSNIDNNLIKFIDDLDSTHPVVVVQGLGFVGLAMSLVVANSSNEHYNVIGVDRPTPNSYWKICEINNGICPVKSSDPLFLEYFETAHTKQNLYATHDHRAYQIANVIIVDINLDVSKKTDETGSLDASDVPLLEFKKAIKTIGENCREDVLIIVETTVPPGTCTRVVQPIIFQELEKRGLRTDCFSIGHSYERVMPGPNYINSVKNFYRVYSGIDNKSALRTRRFLETIISTEQYPLTELQNTEATEMAKVLENSYRAMNISFMVEWSRFAEAAGVNLYDVVNAIRLRPTHANMMLPGIGVGGYCLTKDPIMASWASREFFGISQGLGFSVNAVEVNDRMPDFAFEFCMECLARVSCEMVKIAIIGVAYAPGIGDTRSSPVERLAKLLLSKGFELEFHDPYVSYWSEMSTTIHNNMNEIFSNDTEVIIITTAHQDYTKDGKIYEHIAGLSNTPIIIDTVGLLSAELLCSKYQLGKNYFILGVGS